MTYTDTTTSTSVFINDSTATITVSNTNPMTWQLTLKQGTDTVSKRGVISQPETLSYLPARIPSRGEIKSPLLIQMRNGKKLKTISYIFITSVKMAHEPISRESMRGLKAKRLEEERIARINNIVDYIYRGAVHSANHTDESKYLYDLLKHGHPLEFYRTNMSEIISGIKSLFIDCFIEYTTLTTVTARNGKKYDISKIDKDNISDIRGRPTEIGEYIVVDWS